MNPKKSVRKLLSELLDYQYKKRLKSYRLDYAFWIKNQQPSIHLCRDTPCQIILLSFGSGSWAEDALDRMQDFFAQNPLVQLAYGDEDVKGLGGVCGNPWLKPCWSPDTYLSRDYLGSAVAVRRELYEQLTEKERRDEALCHDRLTTLAGGFEKGCAAIAHVDGVFFHRTTLWPLPGEGRPGLNAEPFREDSNNCQPEMPLVSVIIPSKDNFPVLKRCLETLCQTACGMDYEIILVDNGSREQTQEMVRDELRRLKEDPSHGKYLKNTSYQYVPMPFNFSKMCNVGAGNAQGGLLLFLNDDIEAVETGWLEKMAQKALQPWAGAVGCKLLYPDARLIQHAGVTNLPIGPVHKLQCLQNDKSYYDGRNTGIWNMLAVTGACLMMRRDVFAKAGGFCEKLQVTFNDVDLCFTLYDLGYQNIVLNNMYLLHHESLSRGIDETEEKIKRMMNERGILYERHPHLEGRDPYYHSWLNRSVLDTAIKPAFEEGKILEDTRDYEAAGSLQDCRQDECVLLRIEYADAGQLYGYAVVLGSDNACFTRQLLFQSETCPENIYRMDFTEQYRSDLEKNMEDQTNVALCGFRVTFARPLPPGEYRIGVLARDRISGTKLINWNSRTICSPLLHEGK